MIITVMIITTMITTNLNTSSYSATSGELLFPISVVQTHFLK